ncbi:MAG: type IV secretion system DNA-binding domain-containing protein, partial [bacterium]|nr:type IV secretion system DNA-binding domain-containing protein [bacterium]
MIFNRKRQTATAAEEVLLLLEIPRANDKKELAAEQMLASLHGILRSKREIRSDGGIQDHISLEMVARGQRIRFYIWTPKHLQPFVEGQIYAQYPTVQIHEQDEDYASKKLNQDVIYTSELVLTDHETIPIKTFPSFEVDPLAAITATLAKLDEPDEEAWIQILARPIPDDWHKRGSKMIKRINAGGGLLAGSGVALMGQALGALVKPPEPSSGSGPAELSERDKSRIRAIEEKGTKLGYQVKIRIVYAGSKENLAKLRMQAIQGAFKQFNTTNLNGFQGKGPSFSTDKLAEYQARFFIDSGYILNIEELASLFHLPHTSVETPNIVWATTKTAEPPSNIPVVSSGNERELSLFGVTNFRGSNTIFGANRSDRGRHIYVIGQTGTGKTGLLELLTMSDIFYDEGFCVIDPHGDYAQNMLRFIPKRRLKDVIYFNPSDTAYPIGFNPLEVTDPSLKNHISSELVGVLKRMFESWGPRLEYILRYTILALLDYPNATMLDITRMLTEKQFRNDVIKYIKDPVVRTFWTTEFASWNDKFAAEAVAPVLNKVGAFVANPMIRNIVGQTKSTFNIRTHMDEGKILIVNLSRGLVGEDNAAILGALMVTKIQLAAMSRANVPMDQRRPFYLYVDEFQNFATDSFAVILSEARKYGLNLTVANQYVSQMEPVVRDAVFGNVGSMVCFRVGADDGAFLSKYYAPQFEPTDIMQLHNRNFVATMTINGEKSPPFSGSTLNHPPAHADFTEEIVNYSRQQFSLPRDEVEARVEKSMALTYGQTPSPNNNQPNNIPHRSPGRVISPAKAIIQAVARLNEPLVSPV